MSVARNLKVEKLISGKITHNYDTKYVPTHRKNTLKVVKVEQLSFHPGKPNCLLLYPNGTELNTRLAVVISGVYVQQCVTVQGRSVKKEEVNAKVEVSLQQNFSS